LQSSAASAAFGIDLGLRVEERGCAACRSNLVMTGLAAGGLVVVVYFMVFKGWRFSDFFYATRRTMRQGFEQVNKGAHMRQLNFVLHA
jgi:hypothetical protein